MANENGEVVMIGDVPSDDFIEMMIALGSPNRVLILNILSQHTEAMLVKEIVELMDLTQPTVSYHLETLRQARLVTTERRGVCSYMTVNAEAFQRLALALQSFAR